MRQIGWVFTTPDHDPLSHLSGSHNRRFFQVRGRGLGRILYKIWDPDGFENHCLYAPEIFDFHI